jgi:hypothetical protein
MIVVQNALGQSFIFTIGTDSRLKCLMSTSGESDSGWTVINIMDAFPPYSSTVAFDVVQDLTGSVTLSFALQTKDGSKNDVFVANISSQDLSLDRLAKLSSVSKTVSGIQAGFVPESIRLGSSDDGKQPPLTVEGSLNDAHITFQLAAANGMATLLELPENISTGSQNILAHRTGFLFGQRANIFLYLIDSTVHLVAQTIADSNGGRMAFDYSSSSASIPSAFKNITYTCIQTATSRPGAVNAASDIYIGGPGGIYRIPNGQLGHMEALCTTIPDVHDIDVVTDGDNVSVWATCSPNRLYYIYGKRKTGTTNILWNTPILFASDVISTAAIRSLTKKANELFVLTQSNSIMHYWQDPDSTSWRSRTTSPSNAKEYLVQVETYTTHVHVGNMNQALVGRAVKLTSSEWQYCTVNGLVYSLDADTPAEVALDAQGNLTIISSAVDISPPILHIQSK